MVICLEQSADLHVAQLMRLPLTVSCFSKIQIGFTFLVPAHLGSPGKRAIKRVGQTDRQTDRETDRQPERQTADRNILHSQVNDKMIVPLT